MERLLSQFLVKTDTGKEFTINEYQEIIPADGFNDPNAVILGIKRLQTTTGLAVNRINAETFKIVVTDEIVRKVK